MNRILSPGLLVALSVTILHSSALTAVAQKVDEGKPRIAVLTFKNKADNQWWFAGAAQAVQDVFITELVSGPKYTPIDRETLERMLRKHGISSAADMNAASAVRIGKLIGVDYLLTGSVTEYGITEIRGRNPDRIAVAALASNLFDVSTGEIVWADELRKEISVGGFGGGIDDQRMFNTVMKPCIVGLATKLNEASF